MFFSEIFLLAYERYETEQVLNSDLKIFLSAAS